MSSTKVAIVTGANKGLGFATVKGLCEKFDGIVYLTSRDEERGKEACEELKKLGLNPEFHQLDISDETSIAKFVAHIQEKHDKVDVLINNAGILFLKTATEPKLYQAEQTIKVNFTSLVNFCEAILPLVRDGASIVNISSSSGHLSRIPSQELRDTISSVELSLDGLMELMSSYIDAVKNDRETEEGWGLSPYVVSKVGVNAYTFMLHRRLVDKDITVNCVHPGYVQSDMTLGAGDVSPAQASALVLELALEPPCGQLFVWHNNVAVPWCGTDPRAYMDGMIL